MANKSEHLDRLQVAIQELHKRGAVWRESVSVHEAFHGKTVWWGEVEVFDLSGRPEAKRCYVWSHPDGPQDRNEKLVADVEIPRTTSAKAVVPAASVSESRERTKA